MLTFVCGWGGRVMRDQTPLVGICWPGSSEKGSKLLVSCLKRSGVCCWRATPRRCPENTLRGWRAQQGAVPGTEGRALTTPRSSQGQISEAPSNRPSRSPYASPLPSVPSALGGAKRWEEGAGWQEALGFQPKSGLSWKRGDLILNAFQSFGYYTRLDLLVPEMRPTLKVTTGLTT